MFNSLNKKVSGKRQWYQFGHRLPVLTANALLADKRYRFYIEQVKQLAGLPDDHFSHFYQSLVQRFAEFVQAIPDEPNAPLSSLLTNGLLRGVNTLHYFVTEFDNPSPLERYAIFTACLLRDISHVVTHQKVYITDDKGSTIKSWQPFCGPLTEETEGRSYKLFPLSSAYHRIGHSIRVTLARQVMGENGFLWIASDIRLFAEWLEAINDEDEEGSGRLAKVLRLFRKSGSGLIDGLPAELIDELDCPETEHADAFYAWLIDGLQDGTIKTNTADSFVHMTDAGLFVETSAAFKDFAQLYNVPVNQYIVFTQIGNLMGRAKMGAGDFHPSVQLLSDYAETTSHAAGFSNPLSGKRGSMREGMLIRDANMVYLKGGQPGVTPHVKTTAAMRQTHGALAALNDVLKPNQALKNR